MKKRLIIATRGSRLALWQAQYVRDRLLVHRPALEIALLPVRTAGDMFLQAPLAEAGGKGLFIREIENALLDGRADCAVHSMKDVPRDLPPGLVIGAVCAREDARDAYISECWPSLAALPPGARVGTSSLRRQAQLLARRPDLQVAPLRGNVDTRLEKVRAGECDATFMAMAGVRRLGLQAAFIVPLDPFAFTPAPGQGALGIEFARGRADLAELFAFLEEPEARLCVEAERAFGCALNGDCRAALGAYGRLEKGELLLEGMVASRDGKTVLRSRVAVRQVNGQEGARGAGDELARAFLGMGAASLLECKPNQGGAA